MIYFILFNNTFVRILEFNSIKKKKKNVKNSELEKGENEKYAALFRGMENIN